MMLVVGAKASIQEISNEALNLELCRCCQEIIERNKHPIGVAAKVSVPKPSDRINRVLRFMDNYLDRIDVQIAGLDAVLKYARNADAILTARNTDAIEVVCKSTKLHKAQTTIVWRACLCLSIFASYTAELALDVANTGIHEEMIPQFKVFESEPVVQIQILRLFASLLLWPKTHRIIHKTKDSVTFLKNATDEIDKAKKQKEEEMRELERNIMLKKGPKGANVRVYHGMHV
jgi:hypothetical protein